MAVEILHNLPDVRIDRGESLSPMRALAPQRPMHSGFSQLSGRAWFAGVTAVVHVIAIAGFMAAQRLPPVSTQPKPMEVSLVETPMAAEKAPEYTPPPQEIVYSLPMPRDISIETESITPPPVSTAISEPAATVAIAPPVVESVEYVRAPAPVYPIESSRRREHGSVLLRVLVDALGRPAQIQVERSSGHARLDTAARDAVLKALFRPYEVNGVAQPAQVLIPIEFTRRAS